MIHDDQSLMNVERIHYLCLYVKGDANNALDHLVTNDNFIWNILVSRFDNKCPYYDTFTIAFQFTVAHDRNPSIFASFAIKLIK